MVSLNEYVFTPLEFRFIILTVKGTWRRNGGDAGIRVQLDMGLWDRVWPIWTNLCIHPGQWIVTRLLWESQNAEMSIDYNYHYQLLCLSHFCQIYPTRRKDRWSSLVILDTQARNIFILYICVKIPRLL